MRQKAAKQLRREARIVARSRFSKYSVSLSQRSFWKRLKYAFSVLFKRKKEINL